MQNLINEVEVNDVLNDKTNAVPKVKVTAASILFNLEVQRINWEDGIYRQSNAVLYDVLAQCLNYAGDLAIEAAKERNKALEAFYKSHNYQWRKDTPLISRILRAVFGDADRRRISTYSLVLRQAKKSNVAYNGLAKWIEDNGGVQAIKLERSPTFVSAKQKSEIAQNNFDNLTTLAEIKTDALSLLADAEFIGDDCVLLAQQQADGSFVVRALLRSGAAVNAAFTALYAQNKASNDEVKKELEATNDANGALPIAA